MGASALFPPNASSPLPGGGTPGAAGVSTVIRFPFTTSPTTSSTNAIPAGAVVLRAFLDITGNYGVGPTIELGTAADGLGAFVATTENNPSSLQLYDVPQDFVSAGGAVVVTITGGPESGSGEACVEYAVPLS